MRRFVLAIAIAGSVLAAAPALADDPRPKPAEVAATHFRRGVELYDEADFATALVEFRRAYETAPDFRVLYNIAQAEYQLQRYARALDSFRRYLDEGGSAVSPARRAEVERELAKLAGRVARLRVTADPGVEIFVDGELVGRTPLARPITVSAGVHRVRANAPGVAPVEQSVELAGGDDIALPIRTAGQAAPPPTEPPPTTEGESRGVDPRIVGWTVTGLLVAGAAGTGIAALSASGDLEDLKKKPPGTVTGRELEEAGSRATTLALVTDILGVGALAAAGVSLYFTLKPAAKAQPGAAHVRIVPTGLTSLGLRATF